MKKVKKNHAPESLNGEIGSPGGTYSPEREPSGGGNNLLESSLDQQRIKALLIKGFAKEEIQKITKIKQEVIEKVIKENLPAENSQDISKNSIDLYSELQKDLAKVVLLETGKDNRDTSTILNAIKLQAELQEKKIALSKVNSLISTKSIEKLSKNYIHERDKKILEAKENGASFEDLQKEFGMSKASINQAIDRASLKLPEDLNSEEVNPSLISETRGLSCDLRIKVMREAIKNKMNRNQIRDLVNKMKNEGRS